jgi:hypothetical protein
MSYVQPSPSEGQDIVRLFGDLDKHVGVAGEAGIKAKSLNKLTRWQKFLVEILGFGTKVTIDNETYVVGERSLENFMQRNEEIIQGKRASDKLQILADTATAYYLKERRTSEKQKTMNIIVKPEKDPILKLTLNKNELKFIFDKMGLSKNTTDILKNLEGTFSETTNTYNVSRKKLAETLAPLVKNIVDQGDEDKDKVAFARAIIELSTKGKISAPPPEL